MAVHHVFSGLGIGLPMFSGFGAPGIATMLLLTETSSLFLEFRYLLPVAWRSPRCTGLIADAFFFLSFTITRIFMMPLIIFYCYEEIIMVEPIIGYRIMFTAVPSFFAVCLYLLNLYWYVKILKVLGVIRGGDNVELPEEEDEL